MVIIKEFFPSKPKLISEYMENRRRQLRDGGNKFNVKLLYETKSTIDAFTNPSNYETLTDGKLTDETLTNEIITPQIIEAEETQNNHLNKFLEEAQRHISNALAFQKCSIDAKSILNSPSIVRRVTASKTLQNSNENPELYFPIEQQGSSKKSKIGNMIANNDSSDENVKTSNEIITNFNLNLSQLNGNYMKKTKRNLPKKKKIVSRYNERVLNSAPLSQSKTALNRAPNNTPTRELSSRDFNKCGRIQIVAASKTSVKKTKKKSNPKKNVCESNIATKNVCNANISTKNGVEPKKRLVKSAQSSVLLTKKPVIPLERKGLITNKFQNKDSTTSSKSPNKRLIMSRNSQNQPDKNDKLKELTLPVVTVQLF